ncbi:non-canonical purine NTP pyrophosphatase [Tautonia marina]|uniref:non-canonical purine NTP pyrophosphatase n=1 Tax=Tautonia marina TaxID=2653855 RepID=UPI001260E1EB|nr:non-canonical purine NTP pyrophosphatase [Tautonia marina]
MRILHARPSLREQFLVAPKRIEVYFYTSSTDKFLHAYTVFERSGLALKHFKSRTDPYAEDYSLGKHGLLTLALKEILGQIGTQSVFFVEDTSLRIEAFSNEEDYPGLDVKDWFNRMTFDELNSRLAGFERTATIKSDIGLHVPGLRRPLFFHGEVTGQIALTAPAFEQNPQYPWLTPNTFNGWLIPDGSTKRLGEMCLEESWQYDFRTQALELVLDRLEEYTATLNLPPHAYTRLRKNIPDQQPLLFSLNRPVYIVVGKTCAGKSTFGARAVQKHRLKWVEASSVLRMFRSEYDFNQASDLDFAKHILDTYGYDAVARKIVRLYGNDAADGLVITGFRAIEELETIKASFPEAQVLLIEATDRARFQRHLGRGRIEEIKTLSAFKDHDIKQWSIGLLRVAEEFADIKIVNEGTLDDFFQKVDALLSGVGSKSIPGISLHVNPRRGFQENQIYRCLYVLNQAARPLSCDEIQYLTGQNGSAVLHNNANKVLKKVPELAKRYAMPNERVHYEITNAGRAYIRYMGSRMGVH